LPINHQRECLPLQHHPFVAVVAVLQLENRESRTPIKSSILYIYIYIYINIEHILGFGDGVFLNCNTATTATEKKNGGIEKKWDENS